MDPLGGMKEIIVPFHFALSNENGDRARDLHLFKKLKSFIREEEFDEEKFINMIKKVCLDLKTDEVRLQVIEMLIGSKHTTPEAHLAAIECLKPEIDKNSTYLIKINLYYINKLCFIENSQLL